MKLLKNLIWALALLVTSLGAAQSTPVDIVKNGNYDVQGNETLEASQSITLQPTSWIRPVSGTSFTARIVAPGLPDVPYVDNNFTLDNYVFTRLYQEPMTAFNASNANEGDVIESIVYFDGLGRPLQDIQIKAAPDFRDWVTPFEYDAVGRQQKEWLPYPATGQGGSLRSNPTAGVDSYYLAEYASDLLSSDPNPFSAKDFESSPLDRVLEQGAPGEDWKLGNGHNIRMEYDNNVANEVRLYRVTLALANNTYTPSLVGNGSTYYAAGELNKVITKDENWSTGQTHPKDHTMEEFTDKSGKVVLKRTYDKNVAHDTYYVYDDLGNLTYVLSPEVNTSNGVSQTELDDLGYQYIYDHRNRLVEKKLPGKEWEYIVYNTLDQPVMTQHANQRGDDEWIFTKYDAFGRVAYTGLHRQLNPTSRVTMQGFANNTSTYDQYETARTTATFIAGIDVFYTNDAIPSGISEVYTVNYYDRYVDMDGIVLPSSVYGETVSNDVQGLATVDKIRVLETTNWITTVTGYDDKGRVIYSHNKNPYLQTEDIMEQKLDFTGRVLKTRTTHKKTGNADLVIVDSYTYDHMGRAVDHYQTINSGNQERISTTSYDAIGQLVEKNVGNTKANSLESMDYLYNIRGWLNGVNSDSSEQDDIYTYALWYNTTSFVGSTPLYNGNISATAGASPESAATSGTAYAYGYDALNRLVSATDGTNTPRYSVSGITYDKNGNIKTLKRDGHIVANPTFSNNAHYGVMDDMTYSYQGNQLVGVVESGTLLQGFVKEAHSEPSNGEYLYDDNGNLTQDYNKGVLNIQYNHLNLPTASNIGVPSSGEYGGIFYVYDATGTKLKKTVSNGSPTAVETEYAGAFVYEGGDLQFFAHPEGYVSPDGTGGYDYVYQYKDHLGNVRLSFTEDPSNPGDPAVISETSYYPFGLVQKGYNAAAGDASLGNDVAQRWKYSGKEIEESFGLETYDFGWRNYNAALGRWMNTDPLAENYYPQSPYLFALNNPMVFIDPDGRDVVNADEERRKAAEKKVKSLSKTVESAEELYGTKKGDFKNKKDFKRYKSAKAGLNKARKQVKKYTRRSKITQKRIDNFKKNSPKMFDAIDNIQNEHGEEVDVLVGVEPMSDRNGYNSFRFNTNSDGEVRLSTKLFNDDPSSPELINKVSVFLNEAAAMGPNNLITLTTLQVTKHEMGHSHYNIQNASFYQEYLKGLGNAEKNKEGHNPGNPSGVRALEWQNKTDLE